jgi:hypothetical protein
MGVQAHTQTTVKLYPNPANDRVAIESASALGHVRLFDASGRLLHEQQQVSANRIELFVGHLARGLYVVEAGGIRSRLLVND